MKLQASYVERPFRKLRKQLNTFPSNPKPEDVHSLRTQTRRLEATVAALELGQKKESQELVRIIKPVRKAAGKVRDMDVLIGDVLTISGEPADEAAIRLVEHLAKRRVKDARKLHDMVRRHRRDARDCLKESGRIIRKTLKDESTTVDSETGPQILITELSHWPELNEGNLHLFRIRIKELRYMLQLSQHPDEKLVDALGEVKDTVGEWHDWIELSKIARKVLDPQSDSGVIKRIEGTGNTRLVAALTAANKVRERYFGVSDGRRASRKILPMAS